MIISTKNITPIGARSVVEPFKADKETESGLIMSDTQAPETPVMGTVVRTGDTSRFSVGDTLLFRRYSVDKLQFDTEAGRTEIFLVEDEEVIGLYKKEVSQ